jgi:hypothetical protein
MVDPSINPSDRIDGICTIRGDLGTNEEILRHGFIHPFSKPMLFFNRPPAIADFPNLIRGFIRPLAEAWSGDKNNQKENKKRHRSIFKRIAEGCQRRERVKVWVAFLPTIS